MKNSILFIFLVILFSFSSCTEEENTPETEKTHLCQLSLIPLLEYTSGPQIRQAEDGVYAVNVFWNKPTKTPEPYAAGLFDKNGLGNIQIGLIEGYHYRFDCTFIPTSNLPYSEDGKYGLPFSASKDGKVDAVITNKLTISIEQLNLNTNFHQHIYNTATQIDAETIVDRPEAQIRYFGSAPLNFEYAQPTPSVELELKRIYYNLKFTCKDLEQGQQIKVEMGDIDFLLTGRGNSEIVEDDKTLTMKNFFNRWSGSFSNTENIPIIIYYRQQVTDEWQEVITRTLTVERNIYNSYNIVNINKFISSGNIQLENESLNGTSEKELDIYEQK